MASKKLITVFGSTGNQGGSVISVALSHSDLASKYAFRGVTRDPTSSKSQALAAKGVEMVKAELDDPASVKEAVKGSYGVFGVTDFWSHMDKDREIQQGKNIFQGSKEAGVKHFIFSSLPNVEKLTNGKVTGVKHFDSKAIVREFAEENKGDMIASYYEPAMFASTVRGLVKSPQGTPTIFLPFPNDSVAIPLHDPEADGGKFVVGLFEGGEKANGVIVQGVSAWTTPREVVAELSKASGKTVEFTPLPAETFAGFLPEQIREELTDMMVWIGTDSYYGKGTEKKQAESDKWLVEGAKTTSWPEYVEKNGPWEF